MSHGRTYKDALASTNSHSWIDGDTLHRISRCECDKCKEIKRIRAIKREEYCKSYRKSKRKEILAYNQSMRSLAFAKGRQKNISLAWHGCSWIDEDYEFWLAVRSYCKSKSIKTSKLVRNLLAEEIKKGVQS